MCWLRHKSQITWQAMPAAAVSNLFEAAGISSRGWRDDYFWYPDVDTWIEWIKEAHASAPAYQPITSQQRGFDCDKFARHLSDYVAVKYLCNSAWEVWGEASFSNPPGNHAWNIILTEGGLFEIEPQTADIWEVGTNRRYHTRSIYFVSGQAHKES